MPNEEMRPADQSIEQLHHDYETTIISLAAKVEDLKKPQKKDIWDKLGSLTGVIVALVGGLFSLLYNYHQSKQDQTLKNNQVELQKIQLVGTFMPYLAGADERARTVALFEVQEILNTKAAIALAVNVNAAKSAGGNGSPSEGAVDFLHSVATDDKSGDRSAAARALANICGTERWSVKTLADKDADSVNLNPEVTTVESLARFPRPVSFPARADFDELPPERLDLERKTYSVQATAIELKLERDGDYQVLLKGASGQTIIAEIPSPGCYFGANPVIRSDFQSSRDAFISLLTSTRSGTSGTKVEVAGVAFFDRWHNQIGMAPNGMELHPVLSFKVLQDQK